ncbi:hypothetical protein [Kaarinaea lacus]
MLDERGGYVMRVFWISIFLFLVIVGSSVALYEQAENPQQEVSAQEESINANPFVEDESLAKQVDLAALPNGQPEAATVAQPIADATAPGESQSQAEPPAEPDSTLTAVSSTDTPANESDSVTSVVDSAEAENALQKKPLGLLARSIEQKKNENKVAVIVHLENNQLLSIDEIRAMYQDRITQWKDGSKIMLYNLPLGDKHREKFSQGVLDMTALEADEAESLRRENNVAINPVRVKAKNIVVSYVEREPNAIAYVPLSMIRDKSNVKVIVTLP